MPWGLRSQRPQDCGDRMINMYINPNRNDSTNRNTNNNRTPRTSTSTRGWDPLWICSGI